MKKILLGICIAAMLLTIPSIYSRVMTEEPNKTVETVMPYVQVLDWLIDHPELTTDEVHTRLKENGIDTLAVEADTLSTLQKRGILTVISVSRMKELLIFNQLPELEHPYDKDGIFIYLGPNSSFNDLTRNVFSEATPIEVNGNFYTFVPGEPNELLSMPLGYDQQMIDDILAAGFNVIPRIGDYPKPEITDRMVEELMAIKQDGIDTVIFNGSSVPYSTKPIERKAFGKQLQEAGYTMGWIEFLPKPQTGFNSLAYSNDMDVVRLHSRQVTAPSLVDDVEIYIRAFKERNIRIAFVNLTEQDYEQAMTTLERFNNRLESKLPGFFTRGQAETFEKAEQPLWQKIVGFIGLIAFLGFAAEVVFKRRILTYIGIAGISLIVIAHFITLGINPSIAAMLLKALVLGLAVTAPVVAVLIPRDPMKKGYLIRSYLATIGTVMLGVWFVVVLLFGNDFFLGINQFKGVDLVYVLPIAFLVLYTLWENMAKILKAAITYWHVVLLGVLALVGLFYLGRGGNGGTPLPFEIEFRMMLEQLLYIRPRTKEFLIGLPLLVLALHVGKTHVKTSYYLLIPAVIGVLSIMNTFTHFHIPLSVSLLRTSYSVVLGFLIGLVFIAIYEYLKKIILREWDRKRWVR